MKVSVRVKPNCRQPGIEAAEDGSLTVRLKSPPVDGKANQELVEVLAQWFSVPKRCVVLRHGQSSRLKVVEILSDD